MSAKKSSCFRDMVYALERLTKDKSHKKNAIELVWERHVGKTGKSHKYLRIILLSDCFVSLGSRPTLKKSNLELTEGSDGM